MPRRSSVNTRARDYRCHAAGNDDDADRASDKGAVAINIYLH